MNAVAGAEAAEIQGLVTKASSDGADGVGLWAGVWQQPDHTVEAELRTYLSEAGGESRVLNGGPYASNVLLPLNR